MCLFGHLNQALRQAKIRHGLSRLRYGEMVDGIVAFGFRRQRFSDEPLETRLALPHYNERCAPAMAIATSARVNAIEGILRLMT